MVLLHGGCWRQLSVPNYGAAGQSYCSAGRRSMEPRISTLDGAGGWPQTFEDISSSVDWLKVIAKDESLDLDKAAVAGHSAGGHLALWASAGIGCLPIVSWRTSRRCRRAAISLAVLTLTMQTFAKSVAEHQLS